MTSVLTDEERHDTAMNDPIGTFVAETQRLHHSNNTDFPKELLIRLLQTELNRYCMEDSFIDIDAAALHEAVSSLNDLRKNDQWISLPLATYLKALHRTARLPQLRYSLERTTGGSGTQEFQYFTRKSKTKKHFWVSNGTAKRVPILEETVSQPSACAPLLNAFTAKISALRKMHRITKLCFIQKEMGPVGAISMMSSLVGATQLPACIYRESHWTNELALAGDRPTESDRLMIVYDLVVSGTGIVGAADIIKEISGADTCAAVVLCGYGEERNELVSPAKQHIALAALDWDDQLGGPVFELKEARGGNEVRTNGSEPREKPGAKRMSTSKKGEVANPPGNYDRQNLPALSKGARTIVEAIYAARKFVPSEAIDSSQERGQHLLRLKKSNSRAIKLKKSRQQTGR